MAKPRVLNPWDVESKQVHDPSGIASCLYAGECRWGGGECYVIVRMEDVQETELPRRSDDPKGSKG